MANFVAGILGNAADGESFTGQAHRLGMVSHATVVGASAPLLSRPGVIVTGGNPLVVDALGTPAMQVSVKAGTCIVQSTASTGGVFSVTLTTQTNLDIAAASATNPRLDVVVAKVFADGTSATNCTIEVLTGVAAASPARPAALSAPPTNTHYFPLGQVRVEANATTIVASKVTQVASTDGIFTTGVGGQVPVQTLTEATTLPIFTPFYAMTEKMRGTVVLPGGATFDGMMTRYINQNVTTDGNGETNLTFGLWVNGVWTFGYPFPNACVAAFAWDNVPPVTYNTPIWTKPTGLLTTTTAGFRCYTYSGGAVAMMTNAAAVFKGIAIGY